MERAPRWNCGPDFSSRCPHDRQPHPSAPCRKHRDPLRRSCQDLGRIDSAPHAWSDAHGGSAWTSAARSPDGAVIDVNPAASSPDGRAQEMMLMTTTQTHASAREDRITGGAGLNILVRSWRPAGTPRAVVVICHGVKSHSGYYAWTAEQFVAEGVAVYALDLHGRGKSDGERFYLEKFEDYLDDVHAAMTLARSREPGLPVFLLGHSAGGVVSSVYTLEHQADLKGFICESFAFQVYAPDFALAVLKGLSHIAPHAHVLFLKNGDFSRDPKVV